MRLKSNNFKNEQIKSGRIFKSFGMYLQPGKVWKILPTAKLPPLL